MTRRSAIHILMGLLVVTMVAFALFNAAQNFQSQGRSFGFDAFEQSAGFPISETLPLPGFEYTPESSYWAALAMGFLNTLKISLVSLVFALALGTGVGLARLSRFPEVRGSATAYVSLVRSVPLLLQLVLIYVLILQAFPVVASSFKWIHYAVDEDGISLYAAYLNNRGLFVAVPKIDWTLLWSGSLSVSWDAPLPTFGGRNLRGGLHLSPEYLALFLGLGIYSSSFIAEIVRGSLQAIDSGQREAARALGMTEFQTLRYVVFPQAWKIMVPPLTSQFLSLTKNSSLGVAVGYPELVSVGGTILNQTGKSFEVITIWMTVYLSLSLLISFLMNRKPRPRTGSPHAPQATAPTRLS